MIRLFVNNSKCSHRNEYSVQLIVKNLPVSGTLLQEKAKEIAIARCDHDFKASNGWLEAFRQRHKLTFSTICGESKDVEQAPEKFFL